MQRKRVPSLDTLPNCCTDELPSCQSWPAILGFTVQGSGAFTWDPGRGIQGLEIQEADIDTPRFRESGCRVYFLGRVQFQGLS